MKLDLPVVDSELGHSENIVEPLDGSGVEGLGSSSRSAHTSTTSTSTVKATTATTPTSAAATTHTKYVHDDLVKTTRAQERGVSGVELETSAE
jgi:hypothetical protein